MAGKTWLCRYPRPMIIEHDIRNKFIGHALKTTQPKTNMVSKTSLQLRLITKKIKYWKESTK